MEEKFDILEIEHHPNSDLIIETPVNYSEDEAKKTLRKIDLRVVPPLTLLYIISFLDRGNIGNAKVAGMKDDLYLNDSQYNTALSLFFVTYILLEIPSNMILKKIRPCIWISSLAIAWGIVMTLMGLVNSHQGLYVARTFLGVAEAGFFPGATYLLTIWYRRYEVQTRMSFFYAGASIAGAFSGLLAYGIEFMSGIGGLAGWKWIFILEGLLAVVVGFFMFFILPDDPLTAKFLTPDERRFAAARLQHDGMEASGRGRITNEDKLTLETTFKALKDWKIYTSVLIWWVNAVGAYGFSYTVPSVVQGLGYTATKAQLMTVPIYVFAMIVTVTISVASDRYKTRSPFILLAIAIAISGLLALLVIPHPTYPGITYAFLFISAGGVYATAIPTICWLGNNIAPSGKRAIAMAALTSLGNIGGIIGSNIFLGSEAPHYWTGYGVCLGVGVMSAVATLVMRFLLKRENDRRDKLSEVEIHASYTHEDELLRMGDASPYFRYTL